MSFSDSFKALSDPTRRDILALLKNGSLSASDISSKFDVSGATISYHLKVLATAGLIRSKREKNFIIYDINMSIVEQVLTWLSNLERND